jgi:hypothetical protein
MHERMRTTLRVDGDVKRELDGLQGDLLRERGSRVGHGELARIDGLV